MNSTDFNNNLKIVYPNEKGSIQPNKDRALRFVKIRTMLKKKQKK